MSRTYRNRPRCFRHPSTTPIMRLEIAAREALADEGFVSPNRQRCRANPHSDAIPTAWDDLSYHTRERSKPKVKIARVSGKLGA